jgi:hypothetical protein
MNSAYDIEMKNGRMKYQNLSLVFLPFLVFWNERVGFSNKKKKNAAIVMSNVTKIKYFSEF